MKALILPNYEIVPDSDIPHNLKRDDLFYNPSKGEWYYVHDVPFEHIAHNTLIIRLKVSADIPIVFKIPEGWEALKEEEVIKKDDKCPYDYRDGTAIVWRDVPWDYVNSRPCFVKIMIIRKLTA